MNSALKGTLAFVALTLVLAVVIASCGGGGGQVGPLAAEGSMAPLPPQPLRRRTGPRRVPRVGRSSPSLSRRQR